MANLVKEHIIAEIRANNKDIQDMNPKVVAGYVRVKYKCSLYLSRVIAKELTNDGK